MNLKKVYKDIIQDYNNGNYEIYNFSSKKFKFQEEESALYAMNFLIWKFMKSKKDDRWQNILNFVIIPETVININFDLINFEDFFKFMIETKKIN